MGFGWLTLGYFFVASVSMTAMALYSPLAIGLLAGYPMIIFGLYLLAHYHRYFRVAFFTSFLSAPFAIYYALGGMAQFGLSVPTLFAGEIARQALDWAHFIFLTLLTALLLLGVADLCREVGLERHRANAWRDVLLFAFASVLDLIARLPFAFIVANQGYFTAPALIMRLAIVVLNVHLFFSCFRDMCSEDEGLLESEKRRKGKK